MLRDLTFGSPWWLWGLLALPALAGLFVWAERRASVRLVQMIRDPRLRGQLTGAASAGRRRWRYALLLAALGCFVVAVAGPRLGFETLEVHRRGLDLVVIVDVSKSMLATDLAPDRLTRAKLAVQDLLRQLPGDRVGLVAFAGNAFLQAPLTIDYDAVLNATAELDTDLIPLGGTNLGGAIDLALEAFGKGSAGNRAILLLSDGEPTSDTEQADGLQAAQRAAAAGARIYTVGFGTPEGAMIPLANGRRGEFVRDENGQIVRTRLNEPGLTEIAKAAGGFYTRFTNGEAVMRTIIQDGLSKLRAGEIDAKTDRRPIERYQWPLGAGLLFLTLSAIPGERRRYRAPAGIGGVSRESRAVPVRSSTIVAVLLMAGALGLHAEDAIPVDPPSSGNASGPLALYKDGKYDEAFRAFSDLAKENPSQGNLQFDAGASAYMGKQYDEALEAFGKALTSPDANLRAKSHYNFGNTLYRRGASQKEKQAKITDWRNAIQHYNATLDSLARGSVPDPNHALAANTVYNRDLVQHQIDEELKPPPPTPTPTPTPTPSPTPKNDDKKDQKKQDKQQQQQPQDKQDKGDQQKPEDQKGQQPDKQPQPQQSQDKGGSSSSQEQNGSGQSKQSQDGSSNQPSKPDSQQPQPSPDTSPGPGGKPEEQNPQQGAAKNQNGQRNPDQGNDNAQSAPPPGTPDPSGVPNQDQPRQKGDFQANPEPKKDPQAPTDNKGENGEVAQKPAQEEAGKMSAAQAAALLDSLKNEDARVMLNDPTNRRHRDDNTPTKDW